MSHPTNEQIIELRNKILNTIEFAENMEVLTKKCIATIIGNGDTDSAARLTCRYHEIKATLRKKNEITEQTN